MRATRTSAPSRPRGFGSVTSGRRHRLFSQSTMPCELVVRAERARMQRPKRLGGDTKERRGAPRPRGRERTPRPSINRHLPRGQASNSVRANPPPRTAATGITRPQIVACPCNCTARIPRATATLHAHARRPVGQQLNEGAHQNYFLRGLSRPSLAPAPLEVGCCLPATPPSAGDPPPIQASADASTDGCRSVGQEGHERRPLRRAPTGWNSCPATDAVVVGGGLAVAGSTRRQPQRHENKSDGRVRRELSEIRGSCSCRAGHSRHLGASQWLDGQGNQHKERETTRQWEPACK